MMSNMPSTPTTRTTIRTKAAVALLATGLALVGAACSDEDDDVAVTGQDDAADTADDAAGDDAAGDDAAEDDAASGGAELVIADIAFPDSLEVGAGQTVSIVNEDTAAHTVTADDGSFDVDVDGEGTATFDAPAEAGDYAVVCEIHPAMEMTITVTA